MSIHITSAAIRNSKSSGVARLVLLCLCDKANDEGHAWPSRESIMEWSHASPASVKRGLRWLRENGEIVVLKGGGGRSISTRYLVAIALKATRRGSDKPGYIEPLSDEKGLKETPFNGERGSKRPLKGLNSSPNPSVTHQAAAAPAGASAREDSNSENRVDPDQLLDEVIASVGLQGDRIPTYWLPPAASLHVMRWVKDLGLTPEQIVAAARSSRARHHDPPSGPKALDRVMRTLSAEMNADPMSVPADRRGHRGADPPKYRSESSEAIATLRAKYGMD